MSVKEDKRYESLVLKEWKELTQESQFNKINELTKNYHENTKVEVTKVHNQAIEVNLFIEKSEVYDFLVKYETYLREKLGNFPIIVLLKDRADENKKRK